MVGSIHVATETLAASPGKLLTSFYKSLKIEARMNHLEFVINGRLLIFSEMPSKYVSPTVVEATSRRPTTPLNDTSHVPTYLKQAIEKHQIRQTWQKIPPASWVGV